MARFGSVRGSTKVLFTGARAKVVEELPVGGTQEALSNIAAGRSLPATTLGVEEGHAQVPDVSITTVISEQQGLS